MPYKLLAIFSFVCLAMYPLNVISSEPLNSAPIDQNVLNSFIEEANKGDVNAQSLLGGIYYHGHRVRQDYNEAFKWFKKAAEQGDSNAQDTLGDMYYNGDGIIQDYNESFKWYTKAAEQGDISAQHSLGLMYYYGYGVIQNYDEALKWYKKAAQQGDKISQYALGWIYANCEGISRDYNEAFKWYSNAAMQGYASAQEQLGWIYYSGGFSYASQGKLKVHNVNDVSKDYKESFIWFTKAAEQGQSLAKYKLGEMYEWGEGVSKNSQKAVYWYKKAAEQGEPAAYGKLALIYSYGEGVIEDFVEAYKWALLAGMNGLDVAEIKTYLAEKMTYAQIAEAQRRAKEFVPKKENSKNKESFGLEEKTSPKSSGTGFLISSSGYIITAAHVVENAHSIQIFTSSGKYQAKVVLQDEPTDIAILKIYGTEFPYLEIISSTGINVGDKVFSVGFPNVTVQGTEPKYTDGTISSLSGIDNNIRSFQISIPVQPGNSGGPLVTEKGEAIGVVVSKLSDIGMLEATGTLPQNVNYAVKSAFILPLLENLPGWQSQKVKPNDEKMSNTEIINKARNAVALIIVY